MRTMKPWVLATTLAVALLAPTSGHAVDEISITTPAEGATISRSATPAMTLSGGVAFEEPVPTTRTLYLRWNGTPGSTECSMSDAYLADVSGVDPGNGCSGFPGAALTALPGEDDYNNRFPSGEHVKTPITIDASRNITGTITVRGVLNQIPNLAIIDVVVELDEVALRQRFEDAQPTTTSRRDLSLNIDIPAELDRKDVSSVTLTVYFQQYLGAGWTEVENPASSFRLPAYSASFNRRVELNFDNPTTRFTATLSQDATSWTASRSTPPIGSRTLTARAIQGGTVLSTATRGFTVTG
ncbi:MAG TPA: hypothetical protein VM638_03650 [Actinomycetota bacterium]|nr:hypothetical protein [Actinomycetota bacterium]